MSERIQIPKTQLFINNEWTGAASGGSIEVTNPATDEVIASVPNGGAAETTAAIDAAYAAQKAWAARPALERAALLDKLARRMLEDQERLARLMTAEQGKPLKEARGEVAYAAGFFDWAAGEAKRIYGETVPSNSADKRILVLKQPVGVCAAITPWNFPSAMITRKLGPALAAGCTMVIKPAEQTPLSALALAELALEVGFPAGVVNIVTGDAKAIGETLLSDFRVRKLSFTGSTEVGKLLMRNASQNLTRLSLELGGHAPFIVFDDADLDAAVAGAMASKYRNAGQTCVCANRFYVQEGIFEAFSAKLAEAVETLQVGSGFTDGVSIGPLIDDDAMAKVQSHVEDAVAKGAKLRTGGRRAKIDGLADRFYVPTILEDFNQDMKLSSEETFGPVSPLRAFSKDEEAIEMANDSIYGLAAYFYTQNASRLMRTAEALEYGIVGANDGMPSTVQAPFGGMKQSGFGREGGKYVMHEYLETKFVSWGL